MYTLQEHVKAADPGGVQEGARYWRSALRRSAAALDFLHQPIYAAGALNPCSGIKTSRTRTR
jgi:hypothetical protein